MKSDRNAPFAGRARYVCAIAASLSPLVAWSDWESIPDIRLEVEANDNPRLGQNPDERGIDAEELEDHTATRMLFDGRVQLRNAGQRGEVTLQPRIRLDTYSDEIDDDLERQDFYLNVRSAYRWPRSTAGFRANLARESILSAELVDTGVLDPTDPVDDPGDNETGLLTLLDEFRNRANISPYAELSLSERSALLVEARYIDVSYTGPDLRNRTDFSDLSLSVGVGRTIDDRTGASASLIASRYEADANGNETDTVGVEGSFNRELSEIWSFSLTTGLQRSDFAFVDENGERVDNAATNYTLDLSFSKRTEIASLDIGLFRLLNPNAVGFLTERNELRVLYRRQLRERLRAGIGFRAVETGALDGDSIDREYFRADFDLEWSFTPAWALSVRYGAVDQRFSGDRLDGNANLFSIGAVYRGLARPRQQP